MNKADIGLLDELTQVLADINEKCGTDFKLLPLKASSGEFHLLNNERVLFRGKLNVCDYYIRRYAFTGGPSKNRENYVRGGRGMTEDDYKDDSDLDGGRN